MSLAFARLLRYGRPRRLGSLCSSYPSLRSPHSPQPATLIRTLKTTRQLSNKDNSNIPERTQDLTSENENESKLTPDELAAELTKAGVKQHLSDLDQFREDLPSIAKCILTGDFPLKVLSFPDVLPNDRYFSLQRRYSARKSTYLLNVLKLNVAF